jgi:hypothetical protein
MPHRVAMRAAIRKTWLNPEFWKLPGRNRNIVIHPIFLLGTQNGFQLGAEAREYQDLLQYDFIESHYNLTVKENEQNLFFTKFRLSYF